MKVGLESKDADGLFLQQRQAVTAMSTWLKSPSLEFTLSGYAGTGKTFVVSTFLKTIGKTMNSCITAPTHKALHVLERGVGVKGKTLHALHGLRMNVDLANFDIENPQFDPSGTKHIMNYRLIIIDEASMINRSLFILNREASKLYKTKILYVGDPLQLAPVNEAQAAVFTDVADMFTLTDIIRQDKDHDLVELFVMLRDDIINKTSHCITKLIKSRDLKIANDYRVLSSSYDDTILEYYTSDEFLKNIDYIRAGSFSVKSVNKWNGIIRQAVIHNDKDLLDINDILTAYTTQVDSFRNPITSNSSDSFRNTIISNSSDYILNDIDGYVDNIGISTFAVNLQGVEDRKITPKLLVLNHADKSSVAKMTAALNHMHHLAAVRRVPGGFRNYYNFKNSILTMTDISLNDANSRKKVGKDLDYGYALTIHKLQGSTVTNIAIDMRDIIYPSSNPNFSTDVDTRNRLLYVGLSRATTKAIIHY